MAYADYPSVNHGIILKMEAIRVINVGPASGLEMSFSNEDWTPGNALSAYKYADGTLTYSTNVPSRIKASVTGVPEQIENFGLRVCPTSGSCTDYLDIRNQTEVDVLPPGVSSSSGSDSFNLSYRAQANLKGAGSGSATVTYTIVNP